MTKKLFPILLLIGSFASAQVGFNTNNPSATLDVVGNPSDNGKFDGIIAPRISANQLKTKNYTSSQTGALVYVTAPDSSPAGQTLGVISTGYYYFNGDPSVNRWVKIVSSEDQKVRTLASGTVANDDYTILVSGNISLPAANISNQGKIYNLINDTVGNVTVSGIFRINGGNFSNYMLNNSDLGRGVVVQSTGSAWVLISRY
ncbi:hypothetical protein SAMN05880574_107106 [Chryseobacterium sp. RU37D]|uniref:hypothetical protein n=1 Tax=Chryseobacterium sp. RU37D TaxID=1907397 RepID=UPI0009557817|nr:hypothetical protein [Chryseobacterium sp. RU37D]SIQ20000.1 hypothetical protein SAMN05880574_107106 [Chryseobacterium sp. RU37D]